VEKWARRRSGIFWMGRRQVEVGGRGGVVRREIGHRLLCHLVEEIGPEWRRIMIWLLVQMQSLETLLIILNYCLDMVIVNRQVLKI